MLKERKFYPIFKATATGGRLYFENDGDLAKYLLQFIPGKTLDITIKPEMAHRSRQEEKFYHAVVVRLIAEAMSIGDQEAHEFLKGLFLKTEERTPGGHRFERVLSTTELTDTAYREYWQKCQRWAGLATNPAGLSEDSGLELFIPDPNSVDYESY